MSGGRRNWLAALDEMDAPLDEARSRVIFDRLMLRIAERDERMQRWRRVARLLGAVGVALAGGASAFRFLVH